MVKQKRSLYLQQESCGLMNDKIRAIIEIVLVLVGVFLVVKGHSYHSYSGLIAQLIGLGSVLSALYIYNKKYQ